MKMLKLVFTNLMLKIIGINMSLFEELFKLYANSMPIVLKKDDGNITVRYTEEVEESADKIRELIRVRDSQVFNANSNV